MAGAVPAGREAVPVTAESTIEEHGWIRKAQAADPAAFEVLYRMHVDCTGCMSTGFTACVCG